MSMISRLKDGRKPIPLWLHGVLGLYRMDDTQKGHFFQFLAKAIKTLPGDIAEFGVYRGNSTITSGLMLVRAKSKKKIHAFDSFSGFPTYHKNDNPKKFDELYKKGRVTKAHYQAVQDLHEAEKTGLYARHRFAATSEKLVRGRIKALGLKNIILYPGFFDKTIGKVPKDVRYCAVLLDADLYASYDDILEHIWERLVPGGMVYLDEYYSLKYPGPRIAVDAFCARHKVKPTRLGKDASYGDFERWALFKAR